MRERTMKGAWLAASALFARRCCWPARGENAVQTFHAQTQQKRSGAAAGAGRACGLRDRAGRGARRL